MSDGFSASIDDFCVKTSQKIENYCRGVALTTFGMIIEATPVLRGRLRGDWRTNAGSPLFESRPETTASAEEQERVAKEELNAAVAAWDTKSPIFFTNNMPYAVPVEWDGHSSVKAPLGMARVSVATVAANLKAGGV